MSALAAFTPVSLAPEGLTRELTLDEWSREGWGHPTTLRRRVKDGRLPARQIDRRGTYVVLESDLMQQPDLVRLRRSRNFSMPSDSTDTASTASALDDLASLAARLVSTWPTLDADRKAELGRLLCRAA